MSESSELVPLPTSAQSVVCLFQQTHNASSQFHSKGSMVWCMYERAAQHTRFNRFAPVLNVSTFEALNPTGRSRRDCHNKILVRAKIYYKKKVINLGARRLVRRERMLSLGRL